MTKAIRAIQECSECGQPATVNREVEINRTAYRYGVEFEEDVPVRRYFCRECDPDQEGGS